MERTIKLKFVLEVNTDGEVVESEIVRDISTWSPEPTKEDFVTTKPEAGETFLQALTKARLKVELDGIIYSMSTSIGIELVDDIWKKLKKRAEGEPLEKPMVPPDAC